MTREKAYEILDKVPICYGCEGNEDTFPYNCEECESAFLKAFEALKQPEIVRCKDCTFLNDEGNGEYGCTIHDDLYVIADDWFCADGKRKVGDKE